MTASAATGATGVQRHTGTMAAGAGAAAAGADILERIAAQRRLDVAAARARVDTADLRARAAARYGATPPLSLAAVCAAAGAVVAAEFKRASPSKGDIAAADLDRDAQIAAYVRGGAAVISVLTEPTWFRGSLEDMEAARAVAEHAAATHGTPRAAILRKDFVVDAYQVLEARAYGADTLLLIVALLPTVEVLAPLVAASRELGMEPLVEVNCVEELDVAVAAGSRVIGVNNRNLRTFTVDMAATPRVVAQAARTGADVAILSLSGVKTAEDVAATVREVAATVPAAAVRLLRGFLIGEALMRAAKPADMVSQLRAAADASLSASAAVTGAPAAITAVGHFIKVCGVTHVDDAIACASAGASGVGVIMVPRSKRWVGEAAAAAIVTALRGYREGAAVSSMPPLSPPAAPLVEVAAAYAARARALLRAAVAARPLVIGVFQDEDVDNACRVARAASFDVVQLHGHEDAGRWRVAAEGAPPIIKVLHISTTDGVGSNDVKELLQWLPIASLLLLDAQAPGAAASGGAGVTFDPAGVLAQFERGLAGAVATPAGAAPISLPVVLAGGLRADNVATAVSAARGRHADDGWARLYVCGVDASSSLERPAAAAATLAEGAPRKDVTAVSAYIAAAATALSS